MSDATIYNWLKQDKVDRGEIAGLSTDYLRNRPERLGRARKANRNEPSQTALHWEMCGLPRNIEERA
jgi:hypothetical protein